MKRLIRNAFSERPKLGAKRLTQTFFVESFLRVSLRPRDVEKLFDPLASGRKSRERPHARISDQKVYVYVVKGGLGLRGVAFMTVLAVLTVFAVLESTVSSLCLFYKIQYQETTVTVLTVLAVSAVVAVSVVTATPLKLNPPFSSS